MFADADTRIVSEDGIHVIRMPEHDGALSPILQVVSLRLLAYHTGCARATDLDKPRHLVKSVTVERKLSAGLLMTIASDYLLLGNKKSFSSPPLTCASTGRPTEGGAGGKR